MNSFFYESLKRYLKEKQIENQRTNEIFIIVSPYVGS
jgi:hypothetical protein